MGTQSSWENVGNWYNKIVGEKGHYYHQQVILPGVLRLLNLSNPSRVRLLDLACGQGVLARALPAELSYVGIDASPSLIQKAKQQSEWKTRAFLIGDLTAPLALKDKNFTHATLILALQNMQDPFAVLQNASLHLEKNAPLLLVINHPCFRIPRQSSWQIDEQKKIQFRRLDRYLSALKIPISSHPSKQEKSAETWSFHHPLSAYSSWLKKAGFVIELLEEWCSDKTSTGKAAAMENRSRQEFPLFMAIVARKIH